MFIPIAHVQSATIFIFLRRLKFHGKTRDWSLDWSWNITTTTTRTVRFVLEFRKVYVNLGTPLQPCTKLGIRFPPKKLRLNKSSEFAIRRYQIPIRGSKTRLSVASILKSSGRLSKSCTSGQVCLTNSAKKNRIKGFVWVSVFRWYLVRLLLTIYVGRCICLSDCQPHVIISYIISRSNFCVFRIHLEFDPIKKDWLRSMESIFFVYHL